jgi:hypothetical protein
VIKKSCRIPAEKAIHRRDHHRAGRTGLYLLGLWAVFATWLAMGWSFWRIDSCTQLASRVPDDLRDHRLRHPGHGAAPDQKASIEKGEPPD